MKAVLRVCKSKMDPLEMLTRPLTLEVGCNSWQAVRVKALNVLCYNSRASRRSVAQHVLRLSRNRVGCAVSAELPPWMSS